MTANIVITGASKGIGLATARAFAKAGCQVAICARNPQDLDAAIAELKSINPAGKFPATQVDVTNKSQLQQFAAEINKTFGHTDVLINNAGTFIPGKIQDEAPETFDVMMQTNLASAYHFTRLLLPGMITRRQGHIFNICSTKQALPPIPMAAHTASANLLCTVCQKYCVKS